MIRRLPSVVALILTAGTAGLVTGTASHAAQATLGCPGTVQTGEQLATGITVDVGTTPLGAYSLTVTYDPTVLTIASVEGGNSPEFAGTPTTNPGSFTSGSTNISAFQTGSLTGPTGVVSITRVSKPTPTMLHHHPCLPTFRCRRGTRRSSRVTASVAARVMQEAAMR